MMIDMIFKCNHCKDKLYMTDRDERAIDRIVDMINDTYSIIEHSSSHYITILSIIDMCIHCCSSPDYRHISKDED